VLPENCARYEAFTTEMLRYLGIAAEAIAVPAGSFASVKHLLYFTPVSRHDFRKSPTLLEFREAALARFGVKGALRNRLFIERAVGDRRRIANQDAIAALLAGQGYRAVYPGNMSVAEQIEVFSAASHVVGSVGAGLSNMLFAPAEAEIFYICNGLIDPFFWDISGLCDQRFTWFFARPPQRFDQTVFVSDYTVDPTALAVGLREAS
jgi:capsular polysaccharide biosynthesis protein